MEDYAVNHAWKNYSDHLKDKTEDRKSELGRQVAC